MDILTAIKTGKPFKTPEMLDYLTVSTRGLLVWLTDGYPVTSFPIRAMLADTFQVMDIKDNVIKFGKPFKKQPDNSPEAS